MGVGFTPQTGEKLTTLGQGGGYILAPSHNIQADIPPENVVAMYEAIQD